ncbi:MAG: hypothetical protein K2X82_04555, partial [Gemmataceae bacterium]|nr:hypothetical protein [Gemmataceae bacterium]
DSRAAVRRLREELEPPVRPAAASGPSSEELAADPTKKVLLVARLRDHDKVLDNANDAVNLTWGLGVATFGPLAAIGAGLAAYHAIYRPARTVGNFFHPAEGEVPATVAAALAAPAAFALVSWVMWLVRRYFRRRAVASRDRFVADYPRLVDGWGGPVVLGSRETVGALIKMLDPAAAEKTGWLGRLFGG